jgi:hypothetical protein
VQEQFPELVEPPRFGRGGLMWVDAQRGENAVMLISDRERGPAGLDAGANRDDSHYSCGAGALDEGRGGFLTRVEVRV